MTKSKKTTRSNVLPKRHPSLPPLTEGFQQLSGAKLKELQKHLNGGWQTSPLLKKRSGDKQ
jgi:hypothetical protein